MTPTRNTSLLTSTDPADLKGPNTLAPTLHPWIEINVIRKRVRLARRYRWYVILIPVHDCYDLYCSLLQR